MRADYWIVTEAEVMEKTGKPISHWNAALDRFEAESKKSSDVVNHLQNDHGVPRYWARTLTTRYQKGIR